MELPIFQIVVLGFFYGSLEVIKREFKEAKSGKGLMICLIIGMIILICSLFFTPWVMISVMGIFFYQLYGVIKEMVRTTIFRGSPVENYQSEKTEVQRFNVYKVMESRTFPSYDKEYAKQIVIKALLGKNYELNQNVINKIEENVINETGDTGGKAE
jgi:flagellar basal body-associated protein FliL